MLIFITKLSYRNDIDAYVFIKQPITYKTNFSFNKPTKRYMLHTL